MRSVRSSVLILSLLMVLFSPFSAQAKVKHLADIMTKATSEETRNLSKMLHAIRLVPVDESAKENTLMKVTHVEKGSVYHRLGIRVGDLIAAGNASSNKNIELRQE